jgi:hypothetical protein
MDDIRSIGRRSTSQLIHPPHIIGGAPEPFSIPHQGEPMTTSIPQDKT